jgi:nucleoside-diphosphate-sugar epimerase
MSPTVLILGARGRFGSAAARAFAHAGWRVLALIRPGANAPADLAQDRRIVWIEQPLADTAALAATAGKVEVVVHALNPPYTQRDWRNQALPMLESAVALTRALGATLMLPGNVYNFGHAMPALLREDTPQQADTVKGHIRVAMEQHLQRSGVRSIVIRAGDFFGSGHGTWFDQAIVKKIRKGIFTYPGQSQTKTAWAYLPDLARTFVEVAGRRDSLPRFEVLHFAGHTLCARSWLEALQPIAQEQGWLAGRAGLRLRGMPWAIIRLAAPLVPTWAALLEMRYLWNTPHALCNDKLVALLGHEPHTPLVPAARQCLADLGLLSPQAMGRPSQAAVHQG